MDYHQERFDDNSYIVFKDGKPFALFPANVLNKSLISHQGLTYGGLLLQPKTKFEEVLKAFTLLLQQMESEGFSDLTIKMLPNVYYHLPSDELDYLLFKLNAALIRRDITSVIENSNRLNVNSSNRKRGLKRALNNNLEVKESTDFKGFWNHVLIPNLKQQHNAKPVHSVDEIETLHKNFPKNIRQFNVYKNNEIVAGCTIFESKNVAHAQYISANEQKQELGSLDLLFDYLINTIFKNKKYFDFGISNEHQGQHINEGLLSWKESFGARSIVHDFYKVEIKNHHKLNTTLI
jgi:hypothetical protein